MVKCKSLRINMLRITHTGKSVNFPVTIAYSLSYLLRLSTTVTELITVCLSLFTLSSMRRTYSCLHSSFPSLRPVVYRCLQIRQLDLPGWSLFVLLSAVSYLDSREPGKQDVNNALEISQNNSHIPYRHVLVKKIISMVESSFSVPLQRAPFQIRIQPETTDKLIQLISL